MNFTASPMTEMLASEIVHWTYEPPYDLYSMEGSSEELEELMNGMYYGILAEDGKLIGFYCTGTSAQVPDGHQYGAYPKGSLAIDLGVGMRPDLTGQGLGTPFLSFILNQIRSANDKLPIRLTVATFNQRAINLYAKFGFNSQTKFVQQDILFQTMILPFEKL